MRNKLSAILRYQLPEFVREDHEMFITFVRAYYEWMEEEGNVLEFLQTFEDNTNVDLADADFIEEFVRELAVTFPKNILIDTPQLLKIIKEFYIAKGSEQSFRFLFTLMFNAEIDIQEPRQFIHKSSTGQYQSNDYAYITGDNEFKLRDTLLQSPENISASITGETSGATAVIDTLVTTFFQNQKILILDVSSYTGAFIPDEDVLLNVNGVVVSEKIYGVINKLLVTDGGTNYKIDDEVTITDTTGMRAKAKISRLDRGGFDTVTINNGGSGYEVGQYIGSVALVDSPGYGFLAMIKEVDGGGAITAVQILNEGYDYTKKAPGYVKVSAGAGADIELNGDRIGKIIEMEVFDSGIDYASVGTINVTIDSTDGVGAVLTPQLTGVFNEPKIYVNQDDFPSNYDRILDSYYYQDFAYVIQSKISPHEWLGTIKRVAHPAGMKLFGSLLLESFFDIHITLPDDVTTSISYTISFLGEADVTDHPIYSDDYIILHREDETPCTMDLTLNDLDNMKFLPGFNWTIEPFAENTIGDVVTPCQEPMTYMESAEISIET